MFSYPSYYLKTFGILKKNVLGLFRPLACKNTKSKTPSCSAIKTEPPAHLVLIKIFQNGLKWVEGLKHFFASTYACTLKLALWIFLFDMNICTKIWWFTNLFGNLAAITLLDNSFSVFNPTQVLCHSQISLMNWRTQKSLFFMCLLGSLHLAGMS